MKRTVTVTLDVEVELDVSAFTPEFMAEFREAYYPFHTLNEHFEHIAQLYARGLVDDLDTFIEGYGPTKEMGIRGRIVGQETEVQPERKAS